VVVSGLASHGKRRLFRSKFSRQFAIAIMAAAASPEDARQLTACAATAFAGFTDASERLVEIVAPERSTSFSFSSSWSKPFEQSSLKP
jgi:hypothetical protein